MPRMGRLPVIVAALISAAGLFWTAPAFAGNALAPAKVAAVQKAAGEFAKMGAPSQQTGQPPRQADAGAKALLDTVFDIRVVKAAEPLPISEIGRLNDWNKAVLEVGLVYILAGAKTGDLNEAANDPAFTQRVEKNTVDFAPEMGRYMDAQLGISQALLALLNTHLAATPGDREKSYFKKNLPVVYDSAARTLAGAISTLPTAGLSDAWRKQRLPAMQALGTHVAKVVDAEDAKALHDLSLQVAQDNGDAELQAGMRKLADTFKR